MQDHCLRLPIYPTVNSLDYSKNNLTVVESMLLPFFYCSVVCNALSFFPVFSSFVLFYFSFPFLECFLM